MPIYQVSKRALQTVSSLSIDVTHRPSILSTQLSLQTIRPGPRYTGLVGVELVNNAHEDSDRSNKSAEEHGTEARLEVGVGLGGEDTEDIIVLVDGFSVVTTFLLVPPVSVRVTELALDWGWVGVLAVLDVLVSMVVQAKLEVDCGGGTILGSSTETSPWSTVARRIWVMVVRGVVA